MNREPQGVRHDRQVREDAIATEQHVSLARNDFHWAERLRERF
jgi:hypothetical protein